MKICKIMNDDWYEYFNLDEEIELHFKGHKLDEKCCLDAIRQAVEEFYNENSDTPTSEMNFKIKLVSKQEDAYYTSRYYEEQDAREEGHQYWIVFCDKWKKGYGKSTGITVEINEVPDK